MCSKNGDGYVLDTDIQWILVDTYSWNIRTNYFNLKYIFFWILKEYSTDTHIYL